jgi:hypothetical protein
MSNDRKGVRLALSPARKMVLELLHHSKKVPTVPLTRSMNVGPLLAARAASPGRPSWVAIFLKAYAIVARDRPELRRTYLPFPWPHLYEHPISECAVLVERDWDGEKAVLAAKIRGPEEQPLAVIDGYMNRFATAPAETISDLRQLMLLGRLPGFVRRWAFWNTLNLSGYVKSKRFGTFMVSSLGSLGVKQVHPIAPLTTYLSIGPIAANGDVTALIVYDHRVMDGRSVARALVELETALNGPMLAEVRSTTTLQLRVAA